MVFSLSLQCIVLVGSGVRGWRLERTGRIDDSAHLSSSCFNLFPLRD